MAKINKTNKNNFSIIFISVAFLILFLFFWAMFMVRPYFVVDNANNVSFTNHEYVDKNIDETIDPLITPGTAQPQNIIDRKSDYIIGSDTAANKIVYFYDYQCSNCQEQEIILRNLQKKYTEKVQLILRPFPDLKNVFSLKLAIGELCAKEQERFLEFHALAYRNFSRYQDFEQFSKFLIDQIGLDEFKFKLCQSSGAIEDAVGNNADAAREQGVNSVPYIFVNERGFNGALNSNDLEELIK